MNTYFNPVQSETLLLQSLYPKMDFWSSPKMIPYKSIFMAIRESLYVEVKMGAAYRADKKK